MPGQMFSKLNNSFTGWHIPIIIVLTALAYLPASQGSFIFDDNYLIRDNAYIREGHSVSSYLSQEDGITNEADKGVMHTGYYRPLTNFTYHLDYLLWGMKAKGFRTTNILLHILNSLLLYLLINYLFSDRIAAFFAAMVFALHPANTEAVSVIVNRNNLLAVLFFLPSFYFYLRSMEKEKCGLLAVSVLFFGLSIFSKEIGIMGIGVLFLYNRIMSSGSKNIRNEFLSYLPYLLVIFVYMLMRSSVTGPVSVRLGINDILMRIYYVPWLCCYNLSVILLPWKLHSFCVSYPNNPADITVIVPLVLFVSAIIIAILFWRKKRMAFFAAAAFLLALFPILGIIPKSSVSLVAPRWLYFPLIFFAIFLACLIESVKSKRKEMFFILFITVLCYLGGLSFILNRYLWFNEKIFLTQEATAFGNEYFMGDYASLLCDQKKIHEAEQYYIRSIRAYPALPENYNGYATLLIVEKGQTDAAYALLKKAEKLNKSSHQMQEWLHLMGLVKIKRGESKDALDYLFKALSIKQTSEIYNSIGLAYSALNEREKALSYLKKGLELDAKNQILIDNLKKLSQ